MITNLQHTATTSRSELVHAGIMKTVNTHTGREIDKEKETKIDRLTDK